LSYEETQSILLAAFDEMMYKEVEVRIQNKQCKIILSRKEWKALVEGAEVLHIQEDEYRITAPVIQFFPIVDQCNLTKSKGICTKPCSKCTVRHVSYMQVYSYNIIIII
jgi:hypothetical protein